MEWVKSLNTCYLLDVIEEAISCFEHWQVKETVELLYAPYGAYDLLLNILKSNERVDKELELILEDLILSLLELDYLFTKTLMF